tara:strand:+ start:3812 stop:4075 length:264 start_codon:yes stop_codon:yes gene_type:complete
MAANGISTLALKRTRQDTKLAKAEAKRQGKVVATDGTVTGSADPSKPYYRAANTLDASLLPTRYHPSDNEGALVDNAGAPTAGRPWT